MQTPACVRINAPDVINQTIDDETIVLHLGTGRYYSARGTGAHAWDLLSQAVPVSDVVAQFTAAYDAPAEDVLAGIEKFVAYLSDESLVVPAESGGAVTAAPAAQNGTRTAFEPPAMEAFSDLEDLLLLDPVHEVDTQQGWPHASPQA